MFKSGSCRGHGTGWFIVMTGHDLQTDGHSHLELRIFLMLHTCPWIRTREPALTGAATQASSGYVLSSPLNSSSLSVPT